MGKKNTTHGSQSFPEVLRRNRTNFVTVDLSDVVTERSDRPEGSFRTTKMVQGRKVWPQNDNVDEIRDGGRHHE